MSDAGCVLVVDDEAEIRAVLQSLLGHAGWEVVVVATGAEATTLVGLRSFDVVLLDVNLAGESGYDVCRRIRAISEVPIIFLSARDGEADQVLGLGIGGDDYVIKPFAPQVLLARLDAAARRAPHGRRATLPPLEAANVSLDPVGRRVTVAGREIELTKIEFDLLALLLSDPTRAFDRQAVIDSIWGSWYSDDHVVDVTMSRLRRKLAEAGAESLIETVRGVGFRLSSS